MKVFFSFFYSKKVNKTENETRERKRFLRNCVEIKDMGNEQKVVIY